MIGNHLLDKNIHKKSIKFFIGPIKILLIIILLLVALVWQFSLSINTRCLKLVKLNTIFSIMNDEILGGWITLLMKQIH